MNVHFSNLNYFNVVVSDLIRIINDRMKRDLQNQTVLLVFDHIESLSVIHLHRLLALLHIAKIRCGIVLRTTSEHRVKLEDKNAILYDELYIKLTNERLVAKANTKDEMLIFIRDIHGIKNEGFTLDLLRTKRTFSRIMTYITRYKNKGGI